jgi:hypothetical protein
VGPDDKITGLGTPTWWAKLIEICLEVQTTVSYALYRQTTSEDSPTSRAGVKNEWSYNSTPL